MITIEYPIDAPGQEELPIALDIIRNAIQGIDSTHSWRTHKIHFWNMIDYLNIILTDINNIPIGIKKTINIMHTREGFSIAFKETIEALKQIQIEYDRTNSKSH